MHSLSLYFFLQFFGVVFDIPLLAEKKPFHFERFDGMCRDKHVPMRVNYIISKQENNMVFLNATLYANEDIEGDLQTISKVYRCRSKESLDTCELFVKTSPNSYCATISPKMALISPFYIPYNPQLECPIKKDTYRAYNSKIDFTPFFALPLGDWFWKSDSEVIDQKTKKLIMCFRIDGYERHN